MVNPTLRSWGQSRFAMDQGLEPVRHSCNRGTGRDCECATSHSNGDAFSVNYKLKTVCYGHPNG
jgi:hypothetical protein